MLHRRSMHRAAQARRLPGLLCMAFSRVQILFYAQRDVLAAQAGMRRGAAQTLLGLVCAAALLARGAAAAAAALPAMGIPPGTGAWLGVSIDFGVYPRCAPTRRLS